MMLVEGQAEEAFAKNILRPHLVSSGVDLRVVLMWTRRLPSGSGYRGGMTTWGKVRSNLDPLLLDGGAWVTTFLDYYGLPGDFPGLDELTNVVDPRQRVAVIERRLAETLRHPRFIPHLTLHEFEALLFSAPVVVEEHFAVQRLSGHLEAAIGSAGGAELINDGPDTHPKARLRRWVRNYKESSDGPTIASKIGLDTMRAACPHFAGWMTKLESLGLT
jgi:hypothetical protein